MDPFTHQKLISARKPEKEFVKHKNTGRLYNFLVILSVVADEYGKAYYKVFKSIKSEKLGFVNSTTSLVFVDLERAEAEIIDFINNFEKTKMLEVSLVDEESESEKLVEFIPYAV